MSFYSVREMAMRYPSFSESSLRWLIFYAERKGFENCVIRPPGTRKVLIDEMEFLKWLKSGKANPHAIVECELPKPKLTNKPKLQEEEEEDTLDQDEFELV